MDISFSTIQGHPPVTIMRLQGRLDSSSVGYFMDQARQAIDGGAQNILLDFSETPFMSSVGIRALSALYDWLHIVKSAGDQKAVSQAIHDGVYHAPHLKLLNPNPSILKTIHLVALDRYLDIFTDEQLALAAF
jgi:anti-anti-sigma regulatory factor